MTRSERLGRVLLYGVLSLISTSPCIALCRGLPGIVTLCVYSLAAMLCFVACCCVAVGARPDKQGGNRE